MINSKRVCNECNSSIFHRRDSRVDGIPVSITTETHTASNMTAVGTQSNLVIKLIRMIDTIRTNSTPSNTVMIDSISSPIDLPIWMIAAEVELPTVGNRDTSSLLLLIATRGMIGNTRDLNLISSILLLIAMRGMIGSSGPPLIAVELMIGISRDLSLINSALLSIVMRGVVGSNSRGINLILSGLCLIVIKLMIGNDILGTNGVEAETHGIDLTSNMSMPTSAIETTIGIGLPSLHLIAMEGMDLSNSIPLNEIEDVIRKSAHLSAAPMIIGMEPDNSPHLIVMGLVMDQVNICNLLQIEDQWKVGLHEEIIAPLMRTIVMIELIRVE